VIMDPFGWVREMNLFELIAVLLSVALLGGYHLWLARRVRRYPERTIIGNSAIKRRGWVQSVVSERRDILAVQTLRNWSTAASFLATTAILIATGVLHFLVSIPQQPDLLHKLNFLGSTSSTLVTLKLLVIVGLLLVAFFNFAVAIRYYNHVSIEINVPEAAGVQNAVSAIQRMMDRGGLHYTVGMRCFYLVIPTSLWLFGPVWLLLGSMGLCLALVWMDRID